MATVTPGKVFTSNEIVTPANLNLLGKPSVALANNEVTTLTIADGAVTQAKLNSSVTLVPTGAIMPFAMNTAPSGWLAANGNEYSKTGTYAALFAVIGATYGETNGSGSTGTTHFRVPDLCGYFVRGSGTNRDGTASGTFGQKQADAVGPHTHGYDDYYQSSSLSKINDNDRTDAASIRMVNVDIVETGVNLDRTTKSQSPASTTETRPDNIAMLYCIKA
jgi:microcystin-dependent protein